MTDPEQLIAMIENAFAGVTLGKGRSLNECEYADSGGSVTAHLDSDWDDERDAWRQIITNRLTEYTVTFSFTDLSGYRFYLPAYMIWPIQNFRTSESIISDFTIYACDPRSYQFKAVPFTQFFTPKQLESILSFLRFCAENDDYLDGDVARRNLRLICDEAGGPNEPTMHAG